MGLPATTSCEEVVPVRSSNSRWGLQEENSIITIPKRSSAATEDQRNLLAKERP